MLFRENCDLDRRTRINCPVLDVDSSPQIRKKSPTFPKYGCPDFGAINTTDKGIVWLPPKFVLPGILRMRTSITVGLEMPFGNVCRRPVKFLKNASLTS